MHDHRPHRRLSVDARASRHRRDAAFRVRRRLKLIGADVVDLAGSKAEHSANSVDDRGSIRADGSDQENGVEDGVKAENRHDDRGCD